MDELIIPCRELVLIDSEAYAFDPSFAAAHVVAHLDLHLEGLGLLLTPEQEDQANMLASIRLDREGSR